MSQKTVTEFFAKVVADESLLSQLKQAEHLAAIVEFAKKHSYEFSIEDLRGVNPPYRRETPAESKLAPPPEMMYCSLGGCGYTSYATQCITSIPKTRTP